MFRIGDFSKLAKTTTKTLRFYDEIGLLKPSFVDENNGYRYYEAKQLKALKVYASQYGYDRIYDVDCYRQIKCGSKE